MPMRCTEHQDAFIWVVYLVREKDEWGKALFANVEWLWVSFCEISIFPSYPSDINRTAYIAGWQAHHHHQLCFFISNSYKRLSWWWCVCHPSFLTIKSASNDYDVSRGISATRPHFSAPICRNLLVYWNQPHPSPTSSKQPQGIYFEWNLIRVYF